MTRDEVQAIRSQCDDCNGPADFGRDTVRTLADLALRALELDRIGRRSLADHGHPLPDRWGAAFAIGWLESRLKDANDIITICRDAITECADASAARWMIHNPPGPARNRADKRERAAFEAILDLAQRFRGEFT